MLEQTYAGLGSALDSLYNELENLEKERAGIKAVLSAEKSTLARLRRALSNLRSKEGKNVGELHNTEREVAVTGNALDKIIAKLADVLKSIRRKIDKVIGLVALQQDKVDALYESLDRVDLAINTLQNKVEIKKEQVTEVKAAIIEEELLSSKYAKMMTDEIRLEPVPKKFRKIDTSKLDAKTKERFDRVVDELTKTLANAFVKPASENTLRALVAKSPVYAMLNDNGQLPRSVIEAMAIAQLEFEGSRLGDIAFPDDSQVKKMLGLPDSTRVKGKVKAEVRRIGRFFDAEAVGLGTTIAKMVPVEASADADMVLNDKLKADLGRVLMLAMVQQGKLATGTVNNKTLGWLAAGMPVKEGKPVMDERDVGVNNTVKTTGKYSKENAKIARELSVELDEQLGLGGNVLAPRFYKKHESRKVAARRMSKEAVVPERQQKALNTAENTAMELDAAAINTMRALYELDKEATLQAFGVVDPDSVHVDNKESVESNNRAITTGIEALFEFMDLADGRDFYFNYFFSKNGRFFIDSTKIDPQDNTIHRFLFKIANKPVTVNESNMNEFEYAIVQAFDGVKSLGEGFTEADKDVEYAGYKEKGVSAVDKQGAEKTSKDFETILSSPLVEAAKNDKKALLELLKEAKHPGHLVAAIEVLKTYKKGEVFETKMLAEIDSVNNGFSLGNVISPVLSWEKLKNTLNGVGIWIGEQNDKLTYGKWKETEGNLDSYERGRDEINTMRLDRSSPIVQLIGDVTRNMMKYPLMIFVYGGGLSGIRKGITDDLITEQLNKWSTEKGWAEAKPILSRVIDSKIESIKEKYTMLNKGKKLPEAPSENDDKQTAKAFKEIKAYRDTQTWLNRKETTAELIRTTSTDGTGNDNSGLRNIVNLVRQRVTNTYGAYISEYLMTEYEELTKMRDAVAAVFAGAFNVFKAELDARVEAAKGDKGYVSKKEYERILQDMVNEGKVPGILTIDAAEGSKNEKTAIIGTNTRKLDDPTKRLSSSVFGDKSVTINPRVLEYIMSPTSASVGNIHTFDGGLISFLIEEKLGTGVHDALVAVVGNLAKSGKVYNEQLITRALEFNMVERILREGQRTYEGNKDAFEAGVIESVLTKYNHQKDLGVWVEALDAIRNMDDTDESKDAVLKILAKVYTEVSMPTAELMLLEIKTNMDWEKSLLKFAVTVEENKAEMITAGISVNNMAGPDGSTYVMAPNPGKAAVRRIKANGLKRELEQKEAAKVKQKDAIIVDMKTLIKGKSGPAFTKIRSIINDAVAECK